MRTLSVLTWIGNAAAVLCGRHGAVTARAQEVGCSRQAAYEQARRVETAVARDQAAGPAAAAPAQELAALREENRQLWQEFEHAVDFPTAKQQQFAALAAALGLSLNQTQSLLAVILPGALCPSRATLGRWVQAAARRAGPVLQVLDAACPPLVRELCLDEIFCHRRPVLIAVEPHSMAWLLGRRTPDRSGDTWQQAVQPWTHLEAVVSDAGSGILRGLRQFQRQRPHTPEGRALEVGLDLFHGKQEAHRALRLWWAPLEQAWRRAERADEVLAAKRWHGDKLPGQRAAHAANRAWRQVGKLFADYERHEAAVRQLETAYELYRPDGRLNDRAWAEAEAGRALQALSAPLWSGLRNFVRDRRSLTFLDRLHRRLAEAEPRAELREALVELWRLREAGPRARGPHWQGAGRVVQPLLQAQICRGLAADWREAYARVARVLSRTVRASSVVECMNSVVRMHQARHRSLTQELLDLKRLHWNCRTFATGKRRDACPYQHLGLSLPTYDWWALLHCDPAELAQQLSTTKVAA
jgi:hypothetical protein